MTDMSQLLMGLLGLVLILALIAGIIALCLLPYLIARRRGHAYQNIILVLCIFGIAGITWVIALIWALYPSEQSLIDPVLGNPTGTGVRNVGDTLGAVAYGRERGYARERAATPPPATHAGAGFCGACGSPRDAGHKFCAACGAGLP